MNNAVKERERVGRALPDGWKWVKLPEVVFFQEGPGVRSYQFRKTGIKLLNVTNIVNGILDLDKTDKFLEEEVAYGKYAHFLVQENDIIMASSGASWGKIAIARKQDLPLIMNTSTIRFQPLDKNIIISDFLRYCLDSILFKSQIVRLITGAAQPNFGPNHLKQVQIPLPPLAEQKRIAAILNEQMEAVEKARKATEAQLEAAKELPAAYLRAVFNSPEAQNWERKKLGEVCQIIAPQVNPKIPDYGFLPHVNGENIESGTCRLTYLNTAFEDGMTSGKYLFDAGDVLYSKLRPYLRKAVFVDFQGLCSADMYPIKVNLEFLNPQFTAWLLISDEFTEYADKESRRARMPKLNREELFAYNAPIPPISEQKQIALKFSRKLADVETLQKSLQSQLEAINQLPGAILRKAFNGEL